MHEFYNPSVLLSLCLRDSYRVSIEHLSAEIASLSARVNNAVTNLNRMDSVYQHQMSDFLNVSGNAKLSSLSAFLV